VTRTDDLSPQVDGVQTVFSTPVEFVTGTLEVHVNGVRQEPGVHFEEVGTVEFRMFEAPFLGDTLQLQYEVVGPGDSYMFPMVVASGIDPMRS
jgi:hypothetical protein